MALTINTVPAFGLLHIAQNAPAHVNVRAAGNSAIDLYLRCAALCGRSLAATGMTFTLVTNEADLLRARAAALGLGDLAVREHRFGWDVPETLRFHSAHYKLELLEAFGHGAFGPAAVLIDIDTVLLRGFDLPPLPARGILAYDIGDQVLVHQDWPVQADIETVAGRALPPARWWGGEFIAGTAESFAILSETVRSCWTRYLAHADTLHHVGDEMLVSAALNMLAADGLTIVDAGGAGGVVRWWSARTTFAQPRFDAVVGNRSLLHLPADKPFLASEAARTFDPVGVVRRYRRNVGRKSLARRLYGVMQRLRGGEAKLTPRL